MLGLEIEYPFDDKLSIMGDFSYLIANINLKEEYDWDEERLIQNNNNEELKITGLRVSGGISYEF